MTTPKTPQIYATLEEAQMLKNAGYDKHTFFYYFHNENETYPMHVYDISERDVRIGARNKGFEAIPAPTLGEIELPEGWYVVLEIGKWVYYYSNGSAGWFESELYARIHAWIYAKRNGLL